MKIDAFLACDLAQRIQVSHGHATVLGQGERLRAGHLGRHIRHHRRFLGAIQTQGFFSFHMRFAPQPALKRFGSATFRTGNEIPFRRDAICAGD